MTTLRPFGIVVFAASLTCALPLTLSSQGTVVNVDVGNGAGAYSGQGALVDPGNNFWNEVAGSATNLTASDGVTATGVSVAFTSAGGFSYANPNSLLADYQFVTTFFGPRVGTITITGLRADTSHLIYIYSAGDVSNQAGVITLNGVTGRTAGTTSSQFFEGANYVVLDVESNERGEISGTWAPFWSAAAINGLQITEGSLPPRVLGIEGAESPTVRLPGAVVPVTVTFSEVVTLSQFGGAQIQLDFDGTVVDAVHTGETTGTVLRFEGIAPAVTTLSAKVIMNSLQLLGGATLVNVDLANVQLGHGEVALPNDQVSVDRLSVYPPVPGLAQSPHYRFRVREVGGSWQSTFAWFTKCIDDAPVVPFGYYNQFIGGWSHSYCNFEMANDVPVEIEITRLDPLTGSPIAIEKAVPHPRRKVKSWRVESGKAYVVIERPTLFAVDIDGQMDDNPTPSPQFINQNALHGVSIFANPFILDKPDLNDPAVLAVDPGVIPPDDGSWTTLYFKPGVHQLFPGAGWNFGEDFRVRSNKSYYIPGDAIVHGNMNNRDDDGDGRNIRIFGHGTLSGERMDHYVELGLTEADSWRTRPIRIANDAKGCRVEGLTIADPPNHSCTLVGIFNVRPEDFNYVRWCKAISWRANGDGISPNGSGYVEDCFLRTQDDGTYVLGFGIRRMVYWHDVNGMPLRCDSLTARNPVPYQEPLYVEDIDVIYARTGFGGGAGRSVIGYPERTDAFPGNTGAHVVFRNISVEDPFPSRILFGWDLANTVDVDGRVAEGPVARVRFENVRAAAPAVDGTRNILMGHPVAEIKGLVFDDVTLAGKHFATLADFDTNASVRGLIFRNTAPEAMTYLNQSGYGKWFLRADWDTGREPADNDVVYHTAIAGVLTVDAPAYAGTLNVSHAGTATVRVAAGGRLTVGTAVSIGATGPGVLELTAGALHIRNAPSNALSVASGSVHIESGELHWTGNHIEDIRALHAAQVLTFAKGQTIRPHLGAKLIAESPESRLFAAYDRTENRTIVWATFRSDPEGN